MKQKRTYIKPSMRMVVLKASPQLLSGSKPTPPQGIFIDTEAPDFEWDEGGAN